MEEPRIIWVDMRHGKNQPGIHNDLPETWEKEVVASGSGIDDAITKHQPGVLCFDYDLPDQSDLGVLERIRSRHRWLPIVMLTQDHSIEMAVWALRLRVWDYFTKPLEINGLISSFMRLPVSGSDNCGCHDCWAIQPPCLPELRACETNPKKVSTTLAASYVREHLDKKIGLEVVAKLCGMSRSHFSRTFRSNYGITFQNYLVRQRIDKAQALLKDSDLQITQVAFAVGFAELSSFSRTFQRHTGMSPSCYRKAITSRLLQYKEGGNQSKGFPKANLNPALSVGPDGVPRYVNPAASHLLK